MPALLYTADVLCPMTGPPLADGGVLVADGVVTAVGDAAALRGDAVREHHVDGVLLPGLVNAATHCEHADASVLARPGPLHVWLQAVEGLVARWNDDQWMRSARRGVLQLLRAGATTACDVVTQGPAVPALARAGMRGTSWVEVADADVRHADDVVAAVEHALTLPAEGRRVGIAPRSPTSVGTGVLQALAALARRSRAPLHLAVAATSAEVAAVRDGTGPLADAARARGLEFEWLEGGSGLSPVRYADACGALFEGATVAQGVWVDLAEARLLAERGVALVCCPRSNELLQAGEAPLERYAEAGTLLALGTGSFAGAQDADLLAEARAWVLLARRRGLAYWPGRSGPTSLEEQAIRLATVDGARAMGFGGTAGVLEAGRRADLVGVALETTPETVYADLVSRGVGRQVLTVLGGVRKSRRPSADEPWPPLDEPAQAFEAGVPS